MLGEYARREYSYSIRRLGPSRVCGDDIVDIHATPTHGGLGLADVQYPHGVVDESCWVAFGQQLFKRRREEHHLVLIVWPIRLLLHALLIRHWNKVSSQESYITRTGSKGRSGPQKPCDITMVMRSAKPPPGLSAHLRAHSNDDEEGRSVGKTRVFSSESKLHTSVGVKAWISNSLQGFGAYSSVYDIAYINI